MGHSPRCLSAVGDFSFANGTGSEITLVERACDFYHFLSESEKHARARVLEPAALPTSHVPVHRTTHHTPINQCTNLNCTTTNPVIERNVHEVSRARIRSDHIMAQLHSFLFKKTNDILSRGCTSTRSCCASPSCRTRSGTMCSPRRRKSFGRRRCTRCGCSRRPST